MTLLSKLGASRSVTAALLASGIATGFAGSAAAQCDDGETVLKFSLVTKLRGHPKGEAALAWADMINSEMQGELCMEVYPSSELYDDNDVFGALLSNDVQIAAPSASKFKDYSELLTLFDVPFLFDSALHVDEFLRATDAPARFSASIEDDGFVMLGFWTNGMYQMSATRVLRAPDDAQGLTFRVQSASAPVASMMDRLGVEGKSMSFSKVYDALKDGEVQGQYNTWSNISAEGFYLEQAAVVETNHGYLGYPVIMAKSFLDGLPLATRQKLINSFALITHERNRFAYEINQQSRLEILEDEGIILRLNEEELALWRDRLLPIQDEFRANIDAELIDLAISANAAADPFGAQ